MSRMGSQTIEVSALYALASLATAIRQTDRDLQMHRVRLRTLSRRSAQADLVVTDVLLLTLGGPGEKRWYGYAVLGT